MFRKIEFKLNVIISTGIKRYLNYVQGQSPLPRIREYFYYIDHEGMLFLDDTKMKNFTTCFREKAFLKFFYSRLKINNMERYNEEFPYLSLCGRERNYIRCDDTPIVFTHVIQDKKESDFLVYAHGGDELNISFQPNKIYMCPTTGRVYHPAWPQVGNIGLIRSKLANELSQNFKFVDETDCPTHIEWRGKILQLENDWIQNTKRFGFQTGIEASKN